MTTSIPSLGIVELSLAALLLVASAGISIVLRLGLERTIAIAAVRMVAQLSLVGLVLTFVFQQTSPLWTALVALVMVAVAGFEVGQRQGPRFRGWWTEGLGTLALLVVGGFASIFAAGGIMHTTPWYQPQVLIPVLGMILGNTLTGVSLALSTLVDLASREARSIEARLALGATRFEALSEVVRAALRTAMLPILNSLAVAGVVSLPGMMTGQILAGQAPAEAARYQIMILFVISGAAGLGALVAAFAGVWKLTDERHRLRIDRLDGRA